MPVHLGGDPEVPRVHRSGKKAKKKIPEKPDFPDPDELDPYPVLRERWGGPRATCSQNFRPLAAIEAEITTFVTILIY